MKKIFLILAIIALTAMSSCQYFTKEWGGTTKINLEPGEKLVEATWKGDGDLWYMVEPMEDDYVPKTKVFKESSTYGVCEGQVIFVETH